jgi:hypothetical protein
MDGWMIERMENTWWVWDKALLLATALYGYRGSFGFPLTRRVDGEEDRKAALGWFSQRGKSRPRGLAKARLCIPLAEAEFAIQRHTIQDES